jgi:hypothetical protein
MIRESTGVVGVLGRAVEFILGSVLRGENFVV